MDNNMVSIELVIFDLDGTIIDSLDDLTAATNYMLSELGRRNLLKNEVRKLVGQGARRLVQRAMPDASSEDIEHGLNLFLAYNEEHIVDKTKLYPGVIETLDELNRQGRRLAVLSNKNVTLCRKVMNILRVESFFTSVVGADSNPFRKPSPEPVLKLLQEYSIAPGKAAIIGDSINDMAAGKSADVVTIGCTYGYGGPDDLTEADYLVGTFAELLDLPIFRSKIMEPRSKTHGYAME
jgi:phosphoglycolate phosphatase